MKTSFAGVTCLLCAALSVVSTAAFAADLENGSLETPGMSPSAPAGWTTDAWGSVNASFAYLDSGHDGMRSVRIDVSAAGATDSGDAKWISDAFAPSAPNTPYAIADWCRSSVATRLMLNISDGAARSEWLTVAEVPAATNWTHVGGAVLIPAWATQVRVLHVIDQVGWLQADSFAVHPLADSAAPLVSISFDDGWRSSYELLVPRLDAMSMRATHFVISGFVDNPATSDLYYGRAEIQSLIARGHEIQSHTVTHPDLTTLEAPALLAELRDSQAALRVITSEPVVGLAYPFGSYNTAVLNEAGDLYGYSRRLGDQINVAPYQAHELSGVVVSNTFTLQNLASLLDQTQALDGWTILVFHRAADEAPLDSFVIPAVFQQMVDLLAQRRARVLPVGEVLGLWKRTSPMTDASSGVDAGDDSAERLEADAGSMVAEGEDAHSEPDANSLIAPDDVAGPASDAMELRADVDDQSDVDDGGSSSPGNAGRDGAIDSTPSIATGAAEEPRRSEPVSASAADSGCSVTAATNRSSSSSTATAMIAYLGMLLVRRRNQRAVRDRLAGSRAR